MRVRSALLTAERIGARIAAPWLQQHPIEPQFGRVAELIEADGHPKMAALGLGAVGAQGAVPP